MTKWLVWDQINGSREDAEEINANSPEDGACMYAQADQDGTCDGIYSAVGGHPIVVEDWCGLQFVYMVHVEYEAKYFCSPATEEADEL